MIPQFISTYGVDTAAVSIPAWLDLAAVVVGSCAGMLEAQQRRLDLIGYIALSLLCGLGGGLIRDVTLGTGNIYMMRSPYAIPASVITGTIGFLFPTLVSRWPALLEWMDIISVGLFAISGTDKAIVYQSWPMSCLLLGCVTGVGGGMLRDTFLGEVPRIFKRSNLYALCALAGSAAYYFCVMVPHMLKPWAAAVGVAATVLLRRASLRWDIKSPAGVNLGPRVAGPGRRAMARARKAAGSLRSRLRDR